MEELDIIYAKLDGACCPEEVFGAGSDPGLVFRQLAKACHPDRNPSQSLLAQKTFSKLTVLKREADTRLRDGQWGKRIPLSHCVPLEIGSYKVNPKFTVGDVCDLYTVEGQDLIVKVARSHDDNDLMRAESASLKILNDGIKGVVSSGVPTLHETFPLDGKWKREVNVITSFPGFVSAAEVHKKMIVDTRTAVWMFKRILTLLSWVHHFGLVHGAILPPHVMFYPDNDEGSKFALPGKERFNDPRKHAIRLIDWCYAVNYKDRTRLSSWVPAWKDHYAPELLDKSYIGPESDIYMAANLVLYLMQRTIFVPGLQKVLLKCLDKNPKKRYQKTEDVFEDWINAAKAEFGDPKWVDFNL